MFMLRGLGNDWSTMPADEPTVGAEDRTAASTYCGQKFGVTSPDFQPCVDFYAGPHIGEYIQGSGTKVTSPSSSGAKPPQRVPAWLLPSSAVVSTNLTPGTSITTMLPPGLFPVGTSWYRTPLGVIAIVLGAFAGYKLLKR